MKWEEGEVASGDDVGGLMRGVAESGAYPRYEFGDIERLGDIVICAEVKGADFIGDVGAGG